MANTEAEYLGHGSIPEKGIFGPTEADLVVNNPDYEPSSFRQRLVKVSQHPLVRSLAGLATLVAAAQSADIFITNPVLAQEEQTTEEDTEVTGVTVKTEPEIALVIGGPFEQRVQVEQEIHPIYSQFLDADGILIKAPASVDLRTLELVKTKTLSMLSFRPDIKDRIVQNGTASDNAIQNYIPSIAIIPQNASLTDLPDYANLKGTIALDGRPWDSMRGIGGNFVVPITAIGEEILLSLLEGTPVNDGFTHEFAHTIQLAGSTFEEIAEWYKIYQNAKETGIGKFAGDYALSNYGEYWAVLSQLYLRAVGISRADSVEQIRNNDPQAFEFLQSVYGPPPPPTPFNPSRRS